MDSPTSSQSETDPGELAGERPGAPPRAASVSTSPATSTGVDTGIRLALIGLGPAGQFHAERLSLRPEFEIVAACDPECRPARRLPGPRGADRSVNCSLADLLARTDVAAVLITGPGEHRADWAERALAAGKHVCLDPPPCANANELRNLRSAARATGRRLTVLPTFRGGADFRTALDVVHGARLGSLNAARLISWGKVVPPAVTTPASASRAPGASGPMAGEVDLFAHFAYQYVDQLLQLLGRRPQSVFARILPTPGAGSSTALTSITFTLAITFDAGVDAAADALIDVNLASGAVLQTGWMLAGAGGGYSGGRIYLQEESGEICDEPVPSSDRPAPDVYAELIASARSEPLATSSVDDAEAVMRVLDSARESSRIGQSVPLETE
jgi:predicted dehydrogenase